MKNFVNFCKRTPKYIHNQFLENRMELIVTRKQCKKYEIMYFKSNKENLSIDKTTDKESRFIINIVIGNLKEE